MGGGVEMGAWNVLENLGAIKYLKVHMGAQLYNGGGEQQKCIMHSRESSKYFLCIWEEGQMFSIANISNHNSPPPHTLAIIVDNYCIIFFVNLLSATLNKKNGLLIIVLFLNFPTQIPCYTILHYFILNLEGNTFHDSLKIDIKMPLPLKKKHDCICAK